MPQPSRVPATCACGCGQPLIRKRHHSYYPAKFLQGHNALLPRPTRKIPVPEEVKQRTGFCECGCGGRTSIPTYTQAKFGLFAGYPARFLTGHQTRGKLGTRSPGWKGGRIKSAEGYWWIYAPYHPFASSRGYVLEHRLVWEKANKRLLQKGEEIHHLNGDRGDNRPENLRLVSKQEHLDVHDVAGFWRQFWQDPGRRKKQSERVKAWWATRPRDEAFRLARSAAMKKAWTTRKRK